MRISILTFTHNANFGAAIQCFALSEYLRSKGHEVSLLRIRRTPWKAQKSILKRIRGKIGAIYHLFCDLSYVRLDLLMNKRNLARVQDEQFESFYQSYLPPFTEACTSDNEMRDALPESDLFIVGSDQVWNPKNAQRQLLMFYFSFLEDQHRIAYAASFGGSENISLKQEDEVRINELLHRFDAISVRDDVGLRILESRFGLRGIKVCDPSFLIDPTAYSGIAKESSLNGKGCLFSFYFTPDKQWHDDVLFLSESLGLKPRVDWQKRRYRGLEYNPILSMPDWLRLIETSDFVLTNSFHCAVFCILFRKQFIVTPSYAGGIGRIHSLLRDLGLENRLIEDRRQIRKSMEVIRQKIDYDAVFEKIQAQKKIAEQFLSQAIQ